MALYALGEKKPSIHPQAWVHPAAVVIGDVTLGAGSSVWPGAVLRGDCGPIIVGERTSIQDGSIIHTQSVNHTTIGSDCVIGHAVHLEGCILEDLVLVGSNSVVLERVRCCSGSIVGAGSVVTAGKTIPSKALAVGAPVRIIPDKVDPERIRKNAQDYVSNLALHRDNTREVSLAECLSE